MAIRTLGAPVTKIVNLADIADVDGLSDEQLEEAKDKAGRILVDEINSFLDESKSPVQGGPFKAKKADGERSILFEFGDMRDSIEFRSLPGAELEVGIWKPSELPKAYNHNIGDRLPQRQFIPDQGETFRKQIIDKITDAVGGFEKRTKNVADLLQEFDIVFGAAVESQPTATGINLGALLDLTFEDV